MDMKPSLLSLVILIFMSGAIAQQDYPVAKPTDKPGVVASPYNNDRYLDVEDLAPGSLAKDPVAGKVFRIPFPKLSNLPSPVEKAVPQISNPLPSSQLDPGIQFSSGLPAPTQPKQSPIIKARPRPELNRPSNVVSQPTDIESFIAAYVESGNSNDPAANVDFMHSTVESYYGKRNQSRSALLRDRKNYIKRWPQREYWLSEKPKISQLRDGSYEVISRIGYRVQNGGEVKSGKTTSVTRVANIGGRLRIVAVREK